MFATAVFALQCSSMPNSYLLHHEKNGMDFNQKDGLQLDALDTKTLSKRQSSEIGYMKLWNHELSHFQRKN